MLNTKSINFDYEKKSKLNRNDCLSMIDISVKHIRIYQNVKN